MDQQTIIDIGTKSILVAMKIAAPCLLAIMITGLIISIFQAATQISEQTLSFIPKIFAMTAAIVICGSWILEILTLFTIDLFESITTIKN